MNAIWEHNIYDKYTVLEGSQHDIESINAFFRDPFVATVEEDVDEAKEEYDGYFDAQFGAHGLPKGYKWKLECPVMGLKLAPRGKNTKYCGVCKSNVYIVENETEMKEKINQGQCVQLGKDSPRWTWTRESTHRPNSWA